MGKNDTIKSLAKVIGNIAMHKLLLEHTNKPESKNYLRHEIIEYSEDAFEKSLEFNWNNNDKIRIREKSLERIKNLSRYYPDISFNDDEAEKAVEEVMSELEF